MPVRIEFVADMTAVRKAIDDIVRESGGRQIPIGVNAGAGGPGSGGAGIPTAGGVFSGSQHLVAGAFGSIGQQGIPGFAAPFAAGGFYAAGTGGASAGVGGVGQSLAFLGYGGNNATVAYQNVAAAFAGANASVGDIYLNLPPGAGGGRGGGGGGNRGGGGFGGAGFWGRGLGRLVGGGYFAREAFSVLEAQRQYGIDSTLAGGDAGGQLTALLDYRKSVISTFSFIGAAVGYLQDPTGNDETYVRATQRASEVQDQITSRAARDRNDVATARGRAAVAGDPNAYRRRLLSADVTLTTSLAEINSREQEAFRQNAAQARAEFAARGAGAHYNAIDAADAYTRGESTRPDFDLVGQNARIAELNASYRANVSDPLRQAANRQYAGDVSIAAREEMGRIADRDLVTQSTVAGDQLRAQNLQFRARQVDAVYEMRRAINAASAAGQYGDIPGIVTRAASQINTLRVAEERNADFEIALASDRSESRRLLIEGKPLASRIRDIEAVRDDRIRRLDKSSPRYEELERSYQQDAYDEIGIAAAEDERARRYLRTALNNRGAALQLAVDRRPQAGQALQETGDARLEAQKLRDRDDNDNANLVIRNAILQQQALRNQILQQFQPTEIDINRTALNGPRAGEDTGELLGSINENIKGLRADLAQNGGLTAGD